MTAQTEAKFENLWKWSNRIIAPLVAIILALSGLVLKDVWASVAEMDTRLKKIELLQASTTANSFNTHDWSKAKSDINSDRYLLDKRVTRTEETIIGIKESLNRIEKKIDNLR